MSFGQTRTIATILFNFFNLTQELLEDLVKRAFEYLRFLLLNSTFNTRSSPGQRQVFFSGRVYNFEEIRSSYQQDTYIKIAREISTFPEGKRTSILINGQHYQKRGTVSNPHGSSQHATQHNVQYTVAMLRSDVMSHPIDIYGRTNCRLI
jgi:hypothetical protein